MTDRKNIFIIIDSASSQSANEKLMGQYKIELFVRLLALPEFTLPMPYG